MEVSYSKEFFDEMEKSNLASARAVIPFVMDFTSPKSVIDIGCGRGLWLKAFQEAGIDRVEGFDGEYVDREHLAIPKERFHAVNLELPLTVNAAFDLAVCLEVAEHLPAACANILIDNLTSVAPIVLFSAAIPLQGGSHHVNEQWPAYWEAKFKVKGYVPVDAIRRRVWDDKRVSFFYAQNILIYIKESELSKYPKLQKEIETGHGHALPLVHPFIFTYYSERWRLVVPYLGKIPPGLLKGLKRILQRG